MYCRNCGNEIPSHVKFCPNCGVKVVTEMSSPPEKAPKEPTPSESYRYVSAQNRTIAMLLCALGMVGCAGMHRIYVGKWTSGVLYFFTFGGFLLGTLYDLYQLYCGAFKDLDGYPLFGANMMKENYRYRTPKFPKYYKVTAPLCVFLCFTLFTLKIMQGQHPPAPKVQQETQVQKNAEELLRERIDQDLIHTIYVPTTADQSQTPFFAKIENISNQHFRGRIKTTSPLIVDGLRNSWIDLDLEPRESKILAGNTQPPAGGKIETVIEGHFLDKIYEKDATLDYHIEASHHMGDGKLTHFEMFVYVPPNTPDETYIRIAREVKHNYAKTYAMTTVRFCDRRIFPELNDTKILYSHNNILKKSRIMFYTSDETNMHLLPDGDSERKIINIEE